MYALMLPSWADQLLPQFLWNLLIHCLYIANDDILNICMEFDSEKLIFDNMTAVRTWRIFP